MKRFATATLAVLAVLVVGCGGGGGGGDDCATIGARYAACVADPDVTPGSAAADCRAWVCTGDKQTAIDCLLAISGCNETAFYYCLNDNGCPQP